MKRRRTFLFIGGVSSSCRPIINPVAGKPVDKKRVYDVFRDLCYDEDPEHPWSHRNRFTKKALTERHIEKRLKCGVAIQELRHTCKWYFDKVVWTDLCNSILPRTELKAEEQALAR